MMNRSSEVPSSASNEFANLILIPAAATAFAGFKVGSQSLLSMVAFSVSNATARRDVRLARPVGAWAAKASANRSRAWLAIFAPVVDPAKASRRSGSMPRKPDARAAAGSSLRSLGALKLPPFANRA